MIITPFSISAVREPRKSLISGAPTAPLYLLHWKATLAYKLWVDLSTRKIGLPFDENNDVIEEVYNSWYAFFGVARELLKELPATQINTSSELIELTEKVLNKGLRPHLTTWQAKFRCWYDKNRADSDKEPQQLQKEYALYDELIADLKTTNSRMIEYKELLRKIAFGK